MKVFAVAPRYTDTGPMRKVLTVTSRGIVVR
ncbi:hypothetical protein EV666_12228 [Camelimonas lactis]|uniref:Uncharacterized protein n=1 Tax=Camelimonas lactis TaxID=659006 RepID=A0A4R2GIW6_9HYPH|nr:hypothetical protein EV666_12228 [Camelimonas lactis]